jgi:type VI secretion system protein ImpH
MSKAITQTTQSKELAIKQTLDAVLATLPKDIKHYHFFAVMRLLESVSATRFGDSKSASEDPLYLGQNPHITFASSMLDSIRKSPQTSHQWLDVNFFGLLGPNGPMPLMMSEDITRLKRKKKQQISDFLNIFHHRLLSLLYRAWANKEPSIQRDTNVNHGINHKINNYERYIGSLAGYGLPALRKRDTMPDYGKFGHVAYLAGQSKHKQGLESMLYQLFNVPANIEEFIGEWLSIGKEHQCQLRESHYAKQLGVNATLGKNSWQCQYKFKVLLGPMHYDDYLLFLPDQPKIKTVNSVIKNYVGLEFDWEITLLLIKSSIPCTTLGQSGLLGWTAWSTSSPQKSYNDENTDRQEAIAGLRLERQHIPQ